MYHLSISHPDSGSILLEGKYRFRSRAIQAGQRKLRQNGLEPPSDRTWYRISNETYRTNLFPHIRLTKVDKETPEETMSNLDGSKHSLPNVSKLNDPDFARVVQSNHLEMILTNQRVSRELKLELGDIPDAPVVPDFDCFYQVYFKRIIENPHLLPGSGPRIFWMSLPKHIRENYRKNVFPRDMLYNSYFDWCGLNQIAVIPHHWKWFDYILTE